MPERMAAILDPAAGVSGDMLLGALISAGAPREWLHGLPRRLGLDGVTVEIEEVLRASLRATKVTVRAPDGRSEEPADLGLENGHAQPSSGHSHHGHHAGHAHGHAPHRHVSELLDIVDRAEISPRTRARARRALELLAEAEGRVHGMAPDRVALHEVGALDALVDMVGVIEGFEQLDIEDIYTMPVALGNGWVHAAHGLLPVPAPATAYLLEGLPVTATGPVSGEATTPTGAALLRVLASPELPYGWRAVTTGWGAGTRDPQAYPNALRLVLATTAAEAATVTVLATDIDDLSPEYLEPLREAVTGAGALDVQIWTTQGKKGRIGFRLEATTPPNREEAVAEAIFAHSTTAGIRRWSAGRRTLDRREWTLARNAGGSVRVKTVEAPTGPRSKPEYDDIVSEARRSGRPAHDLARELTIEAERLVRATATQAPGLTAAPKESE
jgi:uncharacterized protein (TIGR00299 family) protein